MLLFLKSTILTNYKPCSKVVLEELFSDQFKPQPKTFVERQSEETTSLNQENLPPQCHVSRPPTRYREIGEAQVDVSDKE